MTTQVQLNKKILSSMEDLNQDILLKIFDYLNLDDKIKLRRVCQRWKFLLNKKLSQTEALRIGNFYLGGFNVTSGLQMQCEHKNSTSRKQTVTLFNDQVIEFPADIETQCFNIRQFDYLHRSLKCFSESIKILSIGNINITYRFLIVLANNLPNLQHLEIINCASKLFADSSNGFNKQSKTNDSDFILPNLENFNSQQLETNRTSYNISIFNQNQDELLNMQERLNRSNLLKSCHLVQESKQKKYWPNLKHLLVKQCNLLNEFTLSLLLAITQQSLTHLIIESNQLLTGEFLNYCGSKLKILKIRYCPFIQKKFLQDLVKIRNILNISNNENNQNNQKQSKCNISKQHELPQFIDETFLRDCKNFSHNGIYCAL